MPKTRKNKVIKNVIVIIIALLFLTLALKLDSYQKELETARNNGSQVSELLYGRNRTPGLSCGLLSKSKAEEIIGVNLEQSFVQGPENLVTETNLNNRVFWADSCRYVNSSNSSIYVELYISSYQTVGDAELAFPDIFGKIDENMELAPEGLGSRLVFDGGVFYLLRDSRIIQITASDGSPSKQEVFSRAVFDNLIRNSEL